MFWQSKSDDTIIQMLEQKLGIVLRYSLACINWIDSTVYDNCSIFDRLLDSSGKPLFHVKNSMRWFRKKKGILDTSWELDVSCIIYEVNDISGSIVAWCGAALPLLMPKGLKPAVVIASCGVDFIQMDQMKLGLLMDMTSYYAGGFPSMGASTCTLDI
jgi:hypothetical protein